MYTLYTDDSILAGPDPTEIDDTLKLMRRSKLDITEEETLEDFLGVNIDRKSDGTIHLTQPHLIDNILGDLDLLGKWVKTRTTLTSPSKILNRHQPSEDFDKSFHYRSVVEKLNYLERGIRSDISYIVHQYERFSTYPQKEHRESIRWMGKYLLHTRYNGIISNHNMAKNMEVYMDADFAANYDCKDTQSRDTSRSRY